MSRYFDFNATTPLCPAARDAWLEASEKHWHNPSSLYREAGAARRRLEDAREELGGILGCEPERIVFTSGATESNNALLSQPGLAGKKILYSAVEHSSVREPALRRPESLPIPADRGGGIDLDWLGGQLARGEPPALVSAMAANNETGVLLPWRQIAALCRRHGAPCHCDAAQWIGKLPAADLGECDWITGCAHKFGGPRGTGFIAIPESLPAFRLAEGGPQESGHRAGTENLPGILAMIAALRQKPDSALAAAAPGHARARNAFEARVLEAIPGAAVAGAAAERLWNTSLLILPRHSNLKWLTRLSHLGFSVSTGSACSAGKGNPSHILEAMGLDWDAMGRVLRVSGGWDTTAADWDALAGALARVWDDLESGKRPPADLRG